MFASCVRYRPHYPAHLQPARFDFGSAYPALSFKRRMKFLPRFTMTASSYRTRNQRVTMFSYLRNGRAQWARRENAAHAEIVVDSGA